jgi:hypothetical protein
MLLDICLVVLRPEGSPRRDPVVALCISQDSVRTARLLELCYGFA